ncbi:MAG: outer membrane protein transport protein [Porphyrobacter sp.]|nr:outer membrane protein transport protein [Porphyrobacter sp.]
MKRHHVTSLSGLVAALLWSSNAYASDALNFIGYGPTSVAMGGTGAAGDIGAAGMMINPTTLVLMDEGFTGHIGLDVLAADIEIRNLATGEIDNSQSRGKNNGPYLSPELGLVYRRGDLALGVGVFASAGVGAQYRSDGFLSRLVTNNIDTGFRNFSRLTIARIPISVAYRVTDRLSVGGSLDVMWSSMNLGLLLDTSQLGALAAQQRLTGELVPGLLQIPALSGGYLTFDNDSAIGGAAEGWGVGGKLGATYQISPRTRLGAVYSFKTSVDDLTGQGQLTAVSAVAGNIPLRGEVRLRDFQEPARIRVGVHHEFSDKLSVAVDYQRMFWSSVIESINVVFEDEASGGEANLSFPTNYRDTDVVGVGAQYRLSPQFALRAGFHYAEAPARGSGILAVVPSTPTTHITGGGSWSLGNGDAVDFAVGYAFPETEINGGPPNTSVPIAAKHSQINASLAFSKAF